MSLTPSSTWKVRPLRAVARPWLLAALAAASIVSACVDGGAPTDVQTSEPAFLLVQPNFQALAVVQSAEINRIRVTVRDLATDSVLTVFTQDVDPGADEWQLEIPVEIVQDASLELELTVELINVAPDGTETVQWSGVTTATVTGGGNPEPIRSVDVFPGPPENLGVQSVTIQDPGVSPVIETDTFSVSATVQGGAAGAQAVWGSLDTQVATVTRGGFVETLGPGTARLVAAAGPRADTLSVRVLQQIVGVELDPDSLRIATLGETGRMDATVVDPRGDEVENAVVEWRIEDDRVVAHQGAGLFLALANGATRVTAVGSRGGATAAASPPQRVVPDTAVRAQGVIVVAQAAATIDITPDSLRFNTIDDTASFQAAVLDGAGDAVPDPVILWGVRDSSVAQINQAGRVRSVGNGTTWALARSGLVQDSARIRVRQTAQSIEITPAVDTLGAIGATAQFSVTVLDGQGRTFVARAPRWSIQDTSIASVDDAGLVTARRTGATDLYARVDSVADTARVVVRLAPREVIVAPELDTLHALGQTVRFTATVLDFQGDTLRDRRVSWQSSDAAIARVDSTGLVEAVSNGPARISATVEGVGGSGLVLVRQRVAGIQLMPRDRVLSLNDTVTLQARPVDAQGNEVQRDSIEATFGSLSPIIDVTRLGPLSARVLPLDTGVAQVRVDIGDITERATFEIIAGTPVGLVVRPDSTSVRSGETVQLNAVPVDVGGRDTRLPDTLSIEWYTDDYYIADVDQNGVVTGFETGTAYINAQVVDTLGNPLMDEDFFASAMVTVVPGEAVSLQFVNPVDGDTLLAGDTVQVEMNGNDDYGNFIDSGWSLTSEDPSILEVLNDTLVMGRQVGMTYVIGQLDAAVDTAMVYVGPGPLYMVDVVPDAATSSALLDTLAFVAFPSDRFGNPVFGGSSFFTFPEGAANSVGVIASYRDTVVVPSQAVQDSFPDLFARYPGLASLDSVPVGLGFMATLGNGTTDLIGQITVPTDGSAADTSSVSVAVEVDSVLFGPDSITLNSLGDTLPTSAVAFDANSNPIPGASFTYGSSSAGVATVDGNGRVVATGNGEATITATAVNGISASITVFVQQLQAGVSLTVDTTDLHSFGDTALFMAEAVDANGNPIAGAPFDWDAQPQDGPGDPFHGDLFPQNGMAYFVAGDVNGFQDIIALSGGFADTLGVLVDQRVAMVDIDPDSAFLGAIGDTATYGATSYDARGNLIGGNVSYTWGLTSDNGPVADIDPFPFLSSDSAYVVATGNGGGDVFATGSRTGEPGAADTVRIGVAATPAGITISPDSLFLSAIGDTADVSDRVTVVDSNMNEILGVTPTWNSMDLDVATVDVDGVVTAGSTEGVTGVVAEVNGFMDTLWVSLDIQAGYVDVQPDFDSFDVGGGSPFGATVEDLLGNPFSALPSWNSTDAGVVTVDSDGLTTGVSAGVAGIVGTVDAVADTSTVAVLGSSSILSTAWVGGGIRAQVTQGQTIQVPVTFDMSRLGADGDLGAVQFDLVFDPAVLQFDSTASTIGYAGTADFNLAAADTVSFAGSNTSVQGTSSLTLATFEFTVLANPGTVMDFELIYTAEPADTNFAGIGFPLEVPGRIEVVDP